VGVKLSGVQMTRGYRQLVGGVMALHGDDGYPPERADRHTGLRTRPSSLRRQRGDYCNNGQCLIKRRRGGSGLRVVTSFSRERSASDGTAERSTG